MLCNQIKKLNQNTLIPLYQAKGSKPFSVKYKSSFSNKHSKAYTDIVLNEKDDNIFKNKEITNIFNEYFGSIVEWLDLHIQTEGSSNILLSYTSDGGINHPSIKTIKPNFNITTKFSFKHAFVNDLKQVIKDFKSNNNVGGDILINILK